MIRTGNGRDHRAGHDDAEVGRVRPLQHGQPGLQGELLGAQQHVDRPEEVVPVGQEAQDRERGDGRARERQDDLQEDPEIPGPVDARRLLDLLGQADEELAQEEDPERAGRSGHRHRPQRVEPPEALHDQVVRDEEDHRRHQQGRHDRPEDQPLAAELHPGQRIRPHRGGHEDEGGLQGRRGNAVEEPAEDLLLPAGQGAVGIEDQGFRPRRRGGVDRVEVGLERREEDPRERDEDGQRREDQDGVDRDPAGPGPGPPRRGRAPSDGRPLRVGARGRCGLR